MVNDHYGNALKLDFEDVMSGKTTLNPGVVTFDRINGGNIQVSMRYSVSYPFDEKITEAKLELSKSFHSL